MYKDKDKLYNDTVASVYGDEKAYIYLLVKKNTVLGIHLTAEKVGVTVLDQYLLIIIGDKIYFYVFRKKLHIPKIINIKGDNYNEIKKKQFD